MCALSPDSIPDTSAVAISNSTQPQTSSLGEISGTRRTRRHYKAYPPESKPCFNPGCVNKIIVRSCEGPKRWRGRKYCSQRCAREHFGWIVDVPPQEIQSPESVYTPADVYRNVTRADIDTIKRVLYGSN